MKKLLSLVLALALVLTSMSVAFASSVAPAADIADEDVKVAVERLAALGIVAGKADGKFHENDPLTREEFAKMLVVALNLGKAAEASAGTTRFSDVPATNWAAGYINVAVGKGLILGRGDGTFGLGKPVTSEEAITMLLRAVGYKDEWFPGTWPTNMVNLADEEGLLDEVTFVSGPATRGLAAQLMSAALSLNVVLPNTDTFGGDMTYKKSTTETMMSKYLGVTEGKGVVTSTDLTSGLDENEVIIDATGSALLVVQDDVDASDLIALEIEYLVNEDDEIVYVNVTTPAERILTGTIITKDGDEKHIYAEDGTRVTKKFVTIADEHATVNNDEDATRAALDVEWLYGTFILDKNGKICRFNAYEWEVAGLLVDKVNTIKNTISGYELSGSALGVDLDDDDDVVVVDGAVDSLSDIEANDVVYIIRGLNQGDADPIDYVYVVRSEAVEGTFSKVSSDNKTVTIDDADYAIVSGKATFSTDGNENIKPYTGKNSLTPRADIFGKSVTAILDIKGGVRHMVAGEEGDATYMYGVVTDKDTAVDSGKAYKFIDIYVPSSDDSVSYVSALDAADYNALTPGDVVVFTLDEDGEVDYAEVLVDGLSFGSLDVKDFSGLTTSALDGDYDYIKVGSTKYYVTDTTEIVDSFNSDGDVEPALVDWDDLLDEGLSSATTGVIVYNADKDALFIGFTNYRAPMSITSDAKFAVVADTYYAKKGEQIILIDAEGNEISGNFYAGTADVGDLVAYTTSSDNVSVQRAVYADGTVGAVTGYDITSIEVSKVTSNRIYAKSGAVYLLDEDVVVYNNISDDGEMELCDVDDILAGEDVYVITEASDDTALIIVRQN